MKGIYKKRQLKLTFLDSRGFSSSSLVHLRSHVMKSPIIIKDDYSFQFSSTLVMTDLANLPYIWFPQTLLKPFSHTDGLCNETFYLFSKLTSRVTTQLLPSTLRVIPCIRYSFKNEDLLLPDLRELILLDDSAFSQAAAHMPVCTPLSLNCCISSQLSKRFSVFSNPIIVCMNHYRILLFFSFFFSLYRRLTCKIKS